MIKGGYTYLDLSSVTLGDEEPTTVPGVYQKIKDTFGKPVVISTSANYGEYKIIGFAMNNEGAYGFYGYALLEGGLTAIGYQITSDDSVISIVLSNDGE